MNYTKSIYALIKSSLPGSAGRSVQLLLSYRETGQPFGPGSYFVNFGKWRLSNLSPHCWWQHWQVHPFMRTFYENTSQNPSKIIIKWECTNTETYTHKGACLRCNGDLCRNVCIYVGYDFCTYAEMYAFIWGPVCEVQQRLQVSRISATSLYVFCIGMYFAYIKLSTGCLCQAAYLFIWII